MKTIYITLLISLSLSTLVYSQDLLNLNNFNLNEENYNTAYITSDSSSLTVSTIVSAANAVQNNSKFHFLAYGNFGKLGLGFGAKVNTSFYQIFQTTTAEFLLAKRVDVGKNNNLSFGINGGLILNNIKEDKINAYTELDDPVLVNNTYNKVGFTAGLGFNYNWHNKLDLGVSLPVLIQSIQGVAPVYFTNLSYKQDIGTNFSIKPGIMIYGPNYTTPTIEGNTTISFREYAWVKVGGRSNKTVIFGVGGSVNFIDFGYVYNLSAGGPFNEVYTGLHNVQVAFNFLATKPNNKIKEVDE